MRRGGPVALPVFGRFSQSRKTQKNPDWKQLNPELNSMKIQINKKRKSAFTLIEMIGVLAVIAILAALLIPKIFEAINNARINNACISVNTVKTALADHYAKYGSLASSNGTVVTLPTANFDGILLTEGFIDKPFEVKVSATNDVQIVAGLAAGAVTGTDSRYDLDGDGTADVVGTSTAVVEAVMLNVAAADAWEISKRLDGDNMSAANTTADDLEGRVKYASPGANTVVHVYLTHR
jgi:prepilin-type N-terminal cleavage/methylation domain-containing protein